MLVTVKSTQQVQESFLKLFNLSNQNLIIYLSQLQARAAAAKVIKLILVISWSSSKLRFSLSNNCLLTIFGQKVRSKLLYYSKAPQTLKILFLEQLALLRLMADVFPRWHLNQPRHFFCLGAEYLQPVCREMNYELCFTALYSVIVNIALMTDMSSACWRLVCNVFCHLPG